MLILTRKSGESLMVGNTVVVTVLAVKGNQVMIGVDAPRETTIHREEVFHQMKRTSLAAPRFRKRRRQDARIHRGETLPR